MEITREQVKKAVTEYFERNAEHAITGLTDIALHNHKDHIISIAVSVYCTKHGIGPGGGGFVNAVVDNDLERAISYADDINIHCIKFYIWVLKNLSPC